MFVQEFRERSGLHVNLKIAKQLESSELDNNQQLALYRFAQEALANVHRHSGSKTAAVEFRGEHDTIRATVADAGHGISPTLLEKLRQPRGLAAGVGISGMHERLGIVGGKLEIQSDGHGTKFTAIIPVEYHEVSRLQEPPRFEMSVAKIDRSNSK
jgi:two-component system NarL family sensor kinase